MSHSIMLGLFRLNCVVMHAYKSEGVVLCSPHGSAATPEYDSRQSTLDYSPSSAEDYDTWYAFPPSQRGCYCFQQCPFVCVCVFVCPFVCLDQRGYI